MKRRYWFTAAAAVCSTTWLRLTMPAAAAPNPCVHMLVGKDKAVSMTFRSYDKDQLIDLCASILASHSPDVRDSKAALSRALRGANEITLVISSEACDATQEKKP